MIRLFFLLTGNFPQTAGELTRAFDALLASESVGSADCCRLSDGSIRRFRYDGFKGRLEGRTQISIADVTDLCVGNERLARDNEELAIVNERLQRMYDNMADDVREKERLEFKIFIHDSLGRSLITIKDLIESPEDDIESKLRALREAVNVLSSDRPDIGNTFDDVLRGASDIGVTVDIDGYIPPDTVIEELTWAAVRECVTNYVRHARGDAVFVRVRENAGIFTVTVTNNGEKPKGAIVEGSGLSFVRRSVESAGGEMHVSSEPAFALILNLSRKDNAL